MAAHNFAPAVPRATAEEIDKAWAPIDSLIKKTWSIMVVGATDQSFTAMDWMQVYTAISNWHIYGPGRTQDASSAGSGCEDTDREKFREKMQGLITSLINAEKKKVRLLIQLLSSSFLMLLTPSAVDLARTSSRRDSSCLLSSHIRQLHCYYEPCGQARCLPRTFSFLLPLLISWHLSLALFHCLYHFLSPYPLLFGHFELVLTHHFSHLRFCSTGEGASLS